MFRDFIFGSCLRNDRGFPGWNERIKHMTRNLILWGALLFSLVSSGQVTLMPEPVPGFERRIRNCVDTLPVVDTHEHLVNPAGIVRSGMFDFMLLFHQYADDDIKSAGMSKPLFAALLTDSLSVTGKWRVMKPFYEASFNTAYNRVTMLTAEKLFGISELDDNSVVVLSDKIKAAYQGDWYTHILRDKCRIDYLINDDTDRSFGDPGMFRYTGRFNYLQIDSKAKVDHLARSNGLEIYTLADLVRCLDLEFERAVQEGFVAIKNQSAYFRSLYYEDVSEQRASEIFQRIMKSGDEPLSAEVCQPLADYMWYRILDLALRYDKPVQIHTGLQAGDGNYIQNSNPALLANLFLKYRNVKFILFHGGYPYGGELATLVKNFRNVYMDLCWLYIISPSYSERYLHEWLETVPVGKITGFGGDYENVENIYGHLLFAREILANVLVEKVRKRYFTEEEAVKMARMILHDNAVTLYRLERE